MTTPTTPDSTTLTPRRKRRLIRIMVMLLLVWAVAAYFLLPIAWRVATRHHPAVEGMPRITATGNRIPGDPLNISLVGTEEDVDAAMLAAGWLPADPITLRSSLRIAAGTVLRRSYDTAPMSNLFVWGRKQDLAFQQAVGSDPRRRHHVRFWKSEKVDENGRPFWPVPPRLILVSASAAPPARSRTTSTPTWTPSETNSWAICSTPG